MTRAGRPCPRCRGAMFAERDRQHGGTDFVCISCGHVYDPRWPSLDYEIRQGEEQLAFDRERGQTYDKRRPAMYRKIRL